MKNLIRLTGALASFVLITGCDRSSDRTSTAPENNQPRTERQMNRDNQAIQEGAGTEAKEANKDADNTGRNVRDRSDATLTPGDQGNSDADRDITRRVRRAVTSNDQLSTTAKNIKIITINGKVTLRGPVNTEEEKNAIANAVQQAGVTSFDNQLEVKSTNK